MAVFFDRAAMTVSGTPGTGPITLGSAYYKHQTFAAAGVTNGVQVAYAIEDGANWETGLGTYSSTGPTLTRTTIRYSSNANAAINVSSNAVVYSTFTAEDIPGGGTLAVSAGGTGATSITGLVKGNGASAFTAAVAGTDYASPASVQGPLSIYGDGSDGNVTISGATTLTRDMYYNNLTISAGAAIIPAGFRIFVAGTLDLTAAPASSFYMNGAAGSNATTSSGAVGGVANSGLGAITSASLMTAQAGATGGAGATNATGSVSTYTSSFSYVCGAPISAASAAGGGNGALAANGVASAAYPQYQSPSGFGLIAGPMLWVWGSTATSNYPLVTCPVRGGSGGSGAVAGTGGGGGGSGSSGSAILIVANTIARGSNATTGIIQAKGGNGGNGANGQAGSGGGGGGGNGGNGGIVTIIYGTLTGSSITGAIDVSGGAGGTGGTGLTWWGGQGGSSGASGIVNVTQYPSGSTTFTNYVAGSVGSSPSSSTGAAGASANTKQVAL